MEVEDFMQLQLEEYGSQINKEKEKIKKEHLEILQHLQDSILLTANKMNINIPSKEIKKLALEQIILSYQSFIDICREL